MIFKKTGLDDSYIIELEKLSDARGFFARYYCEREFKEAGLNSNWVQINNSVSDKKGTLRGMHYQNAPFSEVKLVRCVSGEIWDCIIDLRPHSNTFGNYFGAYLSADNRKMMYVPEGFAHGFITLTDNAEVIYLVSQHYTPNAEGSLLWSDPDIGIEWPIVPSVVSDKDAIASDFATLKAQFQGSN